nr:Hint domain-containing protein [Rhodobacter amnigenus]
MGVQGEETAVPVLVDGLPASLRLATQDGWVEAGDLEAGDPVLTFEQGERVVRQVFRSAQAPRLPQTFWPVCLPEGAFDNDHPVELLPAQMVMLESDLAEDVFGEPFVMVPAVALCGWNGIVRSAPREVEIVHLQFDRPQVVFAGRSLLLGCGGTGALAANAFAAPGMMTLNVAAARQLVAGLIREGERARLYAPAQAALAAEKRL